MDPNHQRAIDLMAEAQKTTDETRANQLIAQAQAAAQQVAGTVKGGEGKAAVVFEAVTKHAQEIQARNVGLRPQPQSSQGGSSSSGGGGGAPPPSPTPPVNTWNTKVTYKEPPGVKQAEPDIIITAGEEPISATGLFELTYEDVSGIELINIARSDMIDGQDVIYSPIKNLTRLRERYNPNNIIALPSTSTTFFSKYPIDLILRGAKVPYFNENGNLVVEVENVSEDEQIEVQIDNSGTINRVDFYDYR